MDGQLLLTQAYLRMHTLDAARIFEQMELTEQQDFLSITPPDLIAILIKPIDPVLVSRVLTLIPARQSGEILNQMTTDVAVAILRRIEEQGRTEIIKTIPEPTAGVLRQLMNYPVDCAGAIMDPQVFTLPDDITVFEARARIVKNAAHIISYIYTLDRSRKLTGVVNFSDILLADDTKIVARIAQKCNWTLKPFQRIGQILNNPGWQENHALPVIDEQSVFLGVIGYRTLRGLEIREKGRKNEMAIQDVSMALGELYWLGLSGLIRGFSSAFPAKNK